ncbi:MAG: hypothetical protein ACT4N8_02685 [Sphingosinicella sp.]|uniref:hypothetical protein n=1 Tax=Sphingosinicella sp. TaxID=1917971 RepID=UPI004037E329
MRNLMLLAGAAAIALAAPLHAQGQGRGQGGHGKGHDVEQRDRGEGKGQAANRGRAAERGERAARPDRGSRGREARAERGNRGQGNADRRAERGEERNVRRVERRAEQDVRRAEREVRRGERRAERRIERRAVRVANPAEIVRLRTAPNRGFVRGCPPGLARQNAACLPPGQLRRLQAERSWYANWWPRYRGDEYRYWNGSLYRLEPTGIVAGFIPLAGGALWLNNVWPADYAYDPVPDYYRDYYGWDDPYDYRYADGLVYGLDPETQMIQQLVGLLAGDDWSIGQAMPAGYDVYNVPYAYRDQYYDTPDEWYRYSDGYLYQVDPTTQLVRAVIQLLA